MPESFDWVSGPNGQFRNSMFEIMNVPPVDDNNDEENNPEAASPAADNNDQQQPYYELAFIMEPDNQPQRMGWLNELLNEIQDKTPFAILGSKYKGHAWDGMEDAISPSLLNHLNGNSVYNVTHPLMRKFLVELQREAGSEFEAVPYDYRISQMVHEGKYGIAPEFPFPWLTKEDGNNVELATKSRYGKWDELREDVMESPLKESQVLANFAESNYLEEHISELDYTPALVHGLNVFKTWNPDSHQIALVVTAWDDRIEHQAFLTELEKSNHPFKEIVIIENSRSDVFNNHWSMLDAPLPETSVPVQVRERLARDVTDVCDAPVTKEWFYHTNSKHKVAEKVDLLYTQEHPVSRPVVPYVPAESMHCGEYSACRESKLCVCANKKQKSIEAERSSILF